MNKEQLYAAQTAMIEWLSDPHELGKKPFKIECAGEFDFTKSTNPDFLNSPNLKFPFISFCGIWVQYLLHTLP